MTIQPGDILCWKAGPGSSWLDRLVAWAQAIANDHGDYYHVGFVGPGVFHFYQSKPPVICNSDIPKDLPDYVEVYRLKTPLTTEQLAKIFSYANSQLGKWYNFLGVISFGTIQIGSVAYCSQFVWQSYTYAGIVLCPWENLRSPDDIAASDLLVRVT